MLAPLLALAVASTPSLPTDDWPRFRGPAGAGVAAGRLPAAPSLEAEGAWRAELPGRGHSSPVASAGLVIVTCEEAERGLRTVLALDLEDGSERWAWASEFTPHGQHRLNAFASSTPAVDAAGVVVAWTSGDQLEALALDRDGALVWRRTLGPCAAQHGSGASPVLFEDLVLVAADHEAEGSFLVALERATGEERWRRPRRSVRAAYATPVVLDGPRPQALFASTAHGLTSLDPRSGALLWELDGLFEERVVGSPVLAGALVFVSAGSGSGGKESAAVRLPSGEDGPALAWRAERALPYVPTAVHLDGHLYLWADGGVVSCVDAGSGAERWRERVGGNYFASPVAVGDALVCPSTDGELVALAADPAAYRERFRLDLGEPTQATPAVAGGLLLLRTESHLMALPLERPDPESDQ